MKTILSLLLLVSSIFISFHSHSSGGTGGSNVPPPPGMPACAVNPPPGETACTATPICNVHGFCGTTSASYSADYWPQLGGSTTTGAFCGSIENNAFLSFTAESSTISFDAYVYNCPSGDGIQVFIFSAASCNSGPVTSHVCVNQMYAQNTPYDVTANGLTPGNQYYIMIDGYGGDVCDYTFVATAGIALPLSLSTGNEVTICVGESVTTTAIGGDGVYTWDPSPHLSNINGATVTVTPPAVVGTYTYTVHSSGGGVPNCPATNQYTLTVHVEACCSIDNVINSSTCNVPASTYSLNGTVSVLNPPATGNLVVRDCNGVQQTIASAPFTLGSYPYTVNNLNLNTPNCNIEAYFTGSTDCSHLLTYAAPSTATPTFNPISVCEGATAPTLPTTSLNGISGTWSPATINTSVVGPTNYTFTPGPGHCSPTVNLAVTVNALPDAGIITNPVVFNCSIETDVQLDGTSSTPGATYGWTDALGGNFGIVSGATTLTPIVNLMGTYILTVTNPSTGCTNTASVDVIGDGHEPTVTIQTPGSLTCADPTITLVSQVSSTTSPGGPFVYQWATSDGSITSATNLPDADIDGVGTYTLIVTDPSNGCPGSALVTVTGDIDGPVISPIDADVISCLDSTIVLSGNYDVPASTYSWSTLDGNILGAQDEHILVDLAGTYTFTATNPANGCSTSVNVVVTGNTNIPNVNAGPDLTICPDSTVTLQGSSSTPGVTYSWDATDGSIDLTGFSTIPNPDVPTSAWYILVVTDPTNNCQSRDTMRVVDHILPVIFSDTTLCGPFYQVSVGSVSVSGPFTWSEANGGGTFNDNTILAPIFTPNDPSVVNYTLIVTDACTSDSADVTIIPLPTASSPSGLCEIPKELETISYSGGTWTGNSVTFSPSATAAPGAVTTTATAAPGTYTVIYTDSQCNFADTFTLIYPVDVAIFDDTTVCAPSFQVPTGSVTASGSGQWIVLPSGSGTFSPSSTALHPTFTPNPGVIGVTLIHQDACDSDTASLLFPPQPVVATPPAYSCDGMSEILFTTSYGGGIWTTIDNPSTTWHEDTAVVFVSGNGVPAGANQHQTLVSSHPTAGVYTLTFTDTVCNYSQTVTLNFLPYPWTQVNDTTVCTGVQVQLNAWEGPNPQNYEWNTGANGPSIVATQQGLYYVEASNECYSFIDSATVTYEVCDIEAPNVISLSSQAGNNIWYVNSNGVTEFNCIIVNRWGNLIYEYNDVNSHWDGRDMGGNVVSEGVYFYSIEATYESGEKVKKHGFIHVVQ